MSASFNKPKAFINTIAGIFLNLENVTSKIPSDDSVIVIGIL